MEKDEFQQDPGELMVAALIALRSRKMESSGDLARQYAIVVTELENVYARYMVYVQELIPRGGDR